MENSATLAFLSALPIILILMIVYIKDRKKEPLSLLGFLFILGIASCSLVIVISRYLKNYLPFMNMNLADMDFISIILYSFIGVALIEEACKWIMVYFVGYHHKQFNELYDIIVYAVFVSLGFAFYENLVYIFAKGQVSTAIIRALSAVPGHACDAIFMGYYLSMAKYFRMKKRKDLEKRNILLSILIPTVLHGIYDFCIMSRLTLFMVVFIIFIVYLDYISIKKVMEISKNNKNIEDDLVFCPTCGLKLVNGYCRNCGRKQD
jgi:RsiW-degrading membrane proteinase PrsW (M82 family)